MRRFTVVIGILIVVVLLLSMIYVSCDNNNVSGNGSDIPEGYTTFKEEDIFSISYPKDWILVQSLSDEFAKEIKDDMGNASEESSIAGVHQVFFAGIPHGEAYAPSVKVAVDERSKSGYWTLGEIVKVNNDFANVMITNHKVISQANTTVDGKEAIIIDSTFDDANLGKVHYIRMFTINNKYVWAVLCGSLEEDIENNVDTFDAIVKSLRLF